MITNYDKAIAAFVVGAVVFGLAHFGIKADANSEVMISGIVTAIVVYLVPNK